MNAEPPHADHFSDAQQQRHAARLGMWLVVSSELALFTGLFVLYAAERASDPAGFATGVAHAQKLIGTVNTFVLLLSSGALALAVVASRADRRRQAALFTLATAALGAVFLALKIVEYATHVREHIVPGGVVEGQGPVAFWTLYFVATGVHTVHVAAGSLVLIALAVLIARGKRPARDVALENAALYWHFVDLVWIFLWPLFYLAKGHA